MKTIQSKLAVIFIAFFSCFCFLLPSYAITKNEMGIVINLSGKQRMLTQKMSKEMLLIAKGVDEAQNKENLGKTAALFDKTLKGLIHGDEDLKLVGIEDAKIVGQLERVAMLWGKFKKNVDSVLSGDTSKGISEKIAKENLPLLKNMNRAVKMYEDYAKKLGGESLDARMAVTLNLSGKQRMLTQKMTKEVLLVANGIDPDKNKSELKKTTELFGRTLKGLLDGDDGLRLTGTKDLVIRDQLKLVAELWEEYKYVLNEIMSSESSVVSEEYLVKVAKINLPLLREMNKAVKMYEESVK
ncbi:MAG: hypothetical protein SCARUB_00682 [Candidatus Scalindua rubra]|uniref:NarX-like N-terminal domain-containing protein n=1 Tax=Candidatus Scalindua rubra TaxID=1872076 RepID=A0A1E3XEZ7_9BACT|nr:MAG: hypothetical protein SCARUB_00682 [Candidatus Scalindua rubra]